MDENVDDIQGQLVAKAKECPQEVKRLISKLPGAILDERTSNEVVVEDLKQQLQAAKNELEKVNKAAQDAVQDGKMETDEALLQENEARKTAEAEVERLKTKLTDEMKLVAEGVRKDREAETKVLLEEKEARKVAETEVGLLTAEVADKTKVVKENVALRSALQRLKAKQEEKPPPTAPAAMRVANKADGEKTEEAAKPGQEKIVERKAQYPAPMMVKDRRPLPQGRKREREEPDPLTALEETLKEDAPPAGDSKRPKAESVSRATPVCGNCSRLRRSCDAKPSTCTNCVEGACFYRPCRDGNRCAKPSCEFLHPDQTVTPDGRSLEWDAGRRFGGK
ncbi:hypothetical protein LTR85_008023 [Meristemomyces frigidus]|nr:hypothetical protein LTR85_008023 [Meristemomyces frigidus]